MTEQYHQQQYIVELMNHKNHLFRLVIQYKAEAENRLTRIVATLCQGIRIMRMDELRILKKATESEIKFYDAILRKNLRETLQVFKDTNEYLNDHLTEIIDDKDIKTGDLVNYGKVVKNVNENNNMILKGLFALFNDMEKCGLPKYWV